MKKSVKILIMMIVSIVLVVTMTSCSLLFSIILGLEDIINKPTKEELEKEEYYHPSYGYPIDIDEIGPIYGYTAWGPIRHPDYCQHSSNGVLGNYYPANCTRPETQNYNCYWCCKVVRVETLSGPKHTQLSKYDAVEPSCSPGYTYGEYCYACEQWIVERTEIPAIYDEHVWYGEECDNSRCYSYGKEHSHPTIADATCTEDGESKDFCFQCDKWIVDHIIPATGHNYVDGVCINNPWPWADKDYTCRAVDPATCKHDQGTNTSQWAEGEFCKICDLRLDIACEHNNAYEGMESVYSYACADCRFYIILTCEHNKGTYGHPNSDNVYCKCCNQLLDE